MHAQQYAQVRVRIVAVSYMGFKPIRSCICSLFAEWPGLCSSCAMRHPAGHHWHSLHWPQLPWSSRKHCGGCVRAAMQPFATNCLPHGTELAAAKIACVARSVSGQHAGVRRSVAGHGSVGRASRGSPQTSDKASVACWVCKVT